MRTVYGHMKINPIGRRIKWGFEILASSYDERQKRNRDTGFGDGRWFWKTPSDINDDRDFNHPYEYETSKGWIKDMKKSIANAEYEKKQKDMLAARESFLRIRRLKQQLRRLSYEQRHRICILYGACAGNGTPMV